MENLEKQEQWGKVKRIFGDAIEREPSARSAFLDEACGADMALLTEVESLLAEFDRSVGFSQQPFLVAPFEATAPSDTIGPYRLIRKLGEGGMGQVWLAEQTAPVARQVALKLIRAGFYDASVLQRFQYERQSLAIMDHPAIAKVFDAGTTAAGQPYFVMEYVAGLPITDYCDEKKLTIRERIELFIRACEGVQHAHQKAIIHRDLKPANILVVEVDGKPVPRIIDFGLAKAVTPLAVGATLVTQPGNFLGTPGYMSPEQANPGEVDIDTRTDVYSLGVVLYVLLTGQEPFATRAWRTMPWDEVLRKLREEDPPRPSTRVSSEREASSLAAEARGTEPGQLASELKGDLDWITMRAVEKDRARRYGTPSDLAVDLRRYLSNQPVLARPTSAAYRARKYVRRHRIAVAAAGVFVALLVSFAVFQTVQLRRITRERDRADRITDFMTGVFKVSDPYQRVGNTVTARELLDKAAKEIDTSLANDPELQARMMHVMGKAYLGLGQYPAAEALLERSARVSSSALGPENSETLGTMSDLSATLFFEGRLSEAETLQRKVLAIQQRVLGRDSRNAQGTMGSLALTLNELGNRAEAEKLTRETLEIRKRTLGPDAFQTLVAMDNLSVILAHNGKLEEAEKIERETLDIQFRVYGRENLGTMSSLINMGDIERDLGHYDDAERNYRQALDIEGRVLGPNQPETANTFYGLACLLVKRGQTDQALSLIRQAVDHGLQPLVALDMEKDPCFLSLHRDPGFVALVAYAKEHAAASQKPR